MRTFSLLAVGLTLSACAAKHPPALPEEPTVFEQPLPDASLPPTPPDPAALEPIITPTPEEWQAFTALQAPARPERPRVSKVWGDKAL